MDNQTLPAEQDTSGSAKFVLHRPSYTPSERLGILRAKQLRDDIKAQAAKVIPIGCSSRAQAVPIRTSEDSFGPVILTPDDIAFGPIVLRKEPPEKYPPVKLVVANVCGFYSVRAMDVASPRRTADVVRCRQIIMYLCKTLTIRSFPDIGRTLGGRDHTTVMHGVRKIEARLACDERLADEIEVLKLRIRQAMLNQ